MRSRITVILVGAAILAGGYAPGGAGQTCASIEYVSPGLVDPAGSHSIEYTFDQQYECGQFANGDWFVVTEGGDVTITAITPTATGTGSTFRNGQAVNPSVTSGNNQPWDGRLGGTLTGGATLPINATGGSSVVKYASREPAEPECGIPAVEDCAEFVAVLTVLDAAPANPSQTFRPPYFGSYKPTTITTSDLVTGNLLSVATTSLKISKTLALARVSHQRLEHSPSSTDAGAGGIEPREAYPPDGNTWGADVLKIDSELVFWLFSDQACRDTASPTCTSQENLDAKLPVLIGYVQAGIDIWGAIRAGTSLLRAGGGQGQGKGFVAAFAAAFLEGGTVAEQIDSDIENADITDFWETGSIYKNASTGNVSLWGQTVTEVQYWDNLDTGGPGGHRDPYGYIDGGGILGTSYQRSTSQPTKYMSLILRMSQPISDAMTGNVGQLIEEYGDRWVETGAWATPDPCAPKVGTYAVDYGPNGSGGCIAGSGRRPGDHGATKDCGKPSYAAGCRVSNYSEQMWETYEGSFP